MGSLFPEIPEIREIEVPVKRRMLRPLEPEVTVVQFSSLPPERDLRRLAELLQRHPNVMLRAYGGYDGSIANLDFLRFFPRVKRFSADALHYNDFDDIDGLRHLPDDLVELHLGALTRPRRFSLAPLSRFTSLQTLALEGNFKDVEVVGELRSLRDLTLRSVPLADLSILVPLRELRSLDIKLGGTRDLGLLPQLASLVYLELWRIRGLSDISPVAYLKDLQYLFLQDLSQVDKLPDLSRLEALRRIDILNLRRLTDLSPLRSAPALEELTLTDARHLTVEHLECLVGHPTLKALSVGLGSTRKNEAVARLLPLPRTGTFAVR